MILKIIERKYYNFNEKNNLKENLWKFNEILTNF